MMHNQNFNKTLRAFVTELMKNAAKPDEKANPLGMIQKNVQRTPGKPMRRKRREHVEQGICYLQENKYDLAIACFENAISFDWPNELSRPYYGERARAYELKGGVDPVNHWKNMRRA